MKYNVGDKVRIKSKEWYNKNKNKSGDVDTESYDFIKEMSKYCGKECIITDVYIHSYDIDIDNGEFSWTDEMFDDSYNPEKSHISEQVIKDIAEVIKRHNLGMCISENDGKIIIEPLEKEEDLPIDTPCIVTDYLDLDISLCQIRRYAGNKKTYSAGEGSFDNVSMPEKWNVIIPFDKFNPNNIEESLKYNIVK